MFVRVAPCCLLGERAFVLRRMSLLEVCLNVRQVPIIPYKMARCMVNAVNGYSLDLIVLVLESSALSLDTTFM